MDLKAKAELRIAKPVADVFEAIVDPAKMSRYFISWGSERLAPGKTVTWKWGDVGAEAPVHVVEVRGQERIVFTWGEEKQQSRVEIELVPESREATAVQVTEGTWAADEAGIARLAGQTFGWAHFLLCLKASLEHGINLRTGSITRRHMEEISAAKR